MSIPPPLSELTLERFWDCWKCRILACGGLITSGFYVFGTARKRNLSFGKALQMVFATGLITSGLVVIDSRMGTQTSK